MAAKKKKKVIVSTKSETARTNPSKNVSSELVFGKENYKWLALGIALVFVGMLLMIGGFNENPNVWDESKIYGFRRTVLSPMMILAGLGINIYALFK